ncbi:hypothetical protein SNE40_022642 [Patella caerulea]|uniref:Uncharacterized protein n=1 Tax=Patella caerulea TaxID=87958 RepID=A0AAN8IW12_PATCE
MQTVTDTPPELLASAVKKPDDKYNSIKPPRKAGDVTELRNKYGYNLPPIATLHRIYDLEQNRNLVSTMMRSQTPQVIRLLFTGRLPVGYFNDLCYGQSKQVPPKKSYHYEPKRERVVNLWEPRRKASTSEREITRAINDARSRHRQRLNAISKKAHDHSKNIEGVLLRHLMIEPRGLKAYFNKLERESQRMLEQLERGKCNRSDRKSIALDTSSISSSPRSTQMRQPPPTKLGKSPVLMKTTTAELPESPKVAIKQNTSTKTNGITADVKAIKIKEKGKDPIPVRRDCTPEKVAESEELILPDNKTPVASPADISEAPQMNENGKVPTPVSRYSTPSTVADSEDSILPDNKTPDALSADIGEMPRVTEKGNVPTPESRDSTPATVGDTEEVFFPDKAPDASFADIGEETRIKPTQLSPLTEETPTPPSQNTSPV